YLTLWKYGGIYLDLDVVVIQSLEGLPPNYAGSESSRNVAAGVLSFSSEGTGHELAKLCLEDLRDNFRGSDWGYNGPGVITRLLRRICGVEEAKDMLTEECQGFKVYPTEAFYAIPWWNWTMYFDEGSTEDVLSRSRSSYVIHVWNKHSVHNKIPIGARAPYLLFAQKYCPKVFEECDEFF
ncbi:Gb3 synth and/or Gly transf sug domain containing protein, partial [Asbolus verrucosus]